jgi:hypothetical protein
MSIATLSREFARSRSVFLLLLGLGLGYLAGMTAGPLSVVRADVTEEPRRESFKAGSVLNEPILREIAATLVRIETRVERIEKNMSPQAAVKAVTTHKQTSGNKPQPTNKTTVAPKAN